MTIWLGYQLIIHLHLLDGKTVEIIEQEHSYLRM